MLDFDLGAALADLLQRTEDCIQSLRSAIPAWDEFTKAQRSYDTKFEARSRLLDRLSAPGGVNFPTLEQEIDALLKEIQALEVIVAERWRAFDALKADIVLIAQDLDKSLKRLPVSPEWQNLRAAIEEISFVPMGWVVGGTPGHAAESLVTLRIRLVDMIALHSSGLSTPKRVVPPYAQLRLPSGARWCDIEIRLLSDLRFQVHVRKTAGEVLGFEAAGFADRRGRNSKKPNTAWNTLTLLAKNGGSVRRQSHAKPQKLEKAIETLRKTLKALFGLDEDPFHPCRAGEYSVKFAIRAVDL
jgi:hypothetical protein